jgi:hypothetical protein
MKLHKITRFYTEWFIVCPNIPTKFCNVVILKTSSNKLMIQIKAVGTREIKKVRVPIFYLNKITTYRVTHEAEIQSHISFTSPHSHKVCLDTYIAIYEFVKSFIEKNVSWARNHFLTSFWTSSLEFLFIFGNRRKSDGAKSGLYSGYGRISQPHKFKRFTVATAPWGRTLSCKEQLRVPWSTILTSCAE